MFAVVIGHHGFRWSIVISLTTFLVVGTGVAFFDEVVALKAELAAWEAVHAEANFDDILEQLDDIAGTVFGDVSDEAWYAPYVTSLAEWGIVSGYRDASGNTTGQFGPGNSVTVAEVLKMATGRSHRSGAGSFGECAGGTRQQLSIASGGQSAEREARPRDAARDQQRRIRVPVQTVG
jgi:hypothetical protein